VIADVVFDDKAPRGEGKGLGGLFTSRKLHEHPTLHHWEVVLVHNLSTGTNVAVAL